MKKNALLCLLLAAVLCLAPMTAPAEEAPAGYSLGDEIADFSFTAYDGTEYTLSEVLKEKDMVLINIWATWCGPCKMEFPFMEEAYEAYKDRIEIFALSCEPTDTDDVLADYVKEMGMTFPVGQDTPGMADLFFVEGIPTSVVVDRFGKICFIESGSMPDTDTFNRLFDVFVGEDYAESMILDSVPARKPDVAPTDSQALAVLNTEGGELVFTNPDDEYNWPVVLTTEDDKTCAATTNAGVDPSVSAVNVAVTAAAGDAFAFDCKISTEAMYDFVTVYFNDAVADYIGSGEADWQTYVVPFPAAGDYTVTLAYEKDGYAGEGQDKAWFANVRVLTGDEAAQAIAALPEYPVADEVTLTMASESAKEIVFDDPEGILYGSFGDTHYYIVYGDSADFAVTLTANEDPDAVTASDIQGDTFLMRDCLKDGAYALTAPATEDYNYVSLFPVPGSYDDSLSLVYFASEEAVDAFITDYLTDPETGEAAASWQFLSEAGDLPAPAALPDTADYVLVFTDQNGDPVPGLIANVCDDSTCTPMTTDAEGKIAFTKAPFAYHIQVLKVPEGYTYDRSIETYLELLGGETTFTVTKD